MKAVIFCLTKATDIFAFQCTNEYSDATRKFLIRPPRFQKLDPEIEIKDKIRKINLK